MKLTDITKPVRKELILAGSEMESMVASIEPSASRYVFEQYFKTTGKLLRPSLLLLSAAAANRREYEASKHPLVKAAAAIELVHNASLIHDDIVDREAARRGQKTLNYLYGDRIAVMAGNVLFARAISILLEEISKESAMKTLQMIRKMSAVEINQLKNTPDPDKYEDYIELIRGKTALMMGQACRLGAGIVSRDADAVSAFEGFGLNFGMAYQIVDDYIDQDAFAARHVTLEDAARYAGLAADSLRDFDDSIYKRALLEMLGYIISKAHIEAEIMMKTEV